MQSRAKELLSDHLAGGFSSKTKSSLTKHCSFVSSWVERIFYLSPGQQCVVVKWKSWICINIDWYMWIVSASPRGSAVHVFVFILWMENGGYDTLLISSWGIKEFERQRWTRVNSHLVFGGFDSFIKKQPDPNLALDQTPFPPAP